MTERETLTYFELLRGIGCRVLQTRNLILASHPPIRAVEGLQTDQDGHFRLQPRRVNASNRNQPPGQITRRENKRAITS